MNYNLATAYYSPNGLGQVTSQGSPDSGASHYSYDARGNPANLQPLYQLRLL